MSPPVKTKALAQFGRAFAEISQAIELCLKKDLNTAALVMLSSGIDVAGWMATEKPTPTVQETFTEWVSKYLVPEQSLGCTALELYGLRCGVVHTFSPESKLFGQGKVRKVIFAWHPDRVDALREMIELAGLDQYVALQGDEFLALFQSGLRHFLDDLSDLAEERLVTIADRLFTVMPPRKADQLLDWGRTVLGR